MCIMYRTGRKNASADALSRHPQEPAPMHGIAQDETPVAAVNAETDVSELLQENPVTPREEQLEHYGAEQQIDPRWTFLWGSSCITLW